MTKVQAEARAERVAIMVHCGGLTEDQVQAECDKSPDFYGIRDREEKQGGLF